MLSVNKKSQEDEMFIKVVLRKVFQTETSEKEKEK